MRKKICIFHHGTVLGGAPISLLHLLEELQKQQNINIELLCITKNMQKFYDDRLSVDVKLTRNPLTLLGKALIWGIQPLEFRKFVYVLIDLIRYPLSVYRQYILFKNNNYDLIHLNSAVLFTSAIAARLARIPIVWHIREMLFGSKHSLRKRFAGLVIRSLATKVIACSNAESKALGRDSNQKVAVIPHPVRLPKMNNWEEKRKQLLREMDIPSDAVIVLSSGGVSHWKGTVQILESTQLCDNNVHFLFAGSPPTEKHTKVSRCVMLILRTEDFLIDKGIQYFPITHYSQRVNLTYNRLKRKDHIKFLGYRDNYEDILCCCDIFVYAAMAPHYPRGIFDAWAMKKPVIAFAVESVEDKIDDCIDGILLKEKAPIALSEAIRQLASDAQLRKSMGLGGYEKTSEICNPSDVCKKVVSVYNTILDRRA